MTKNEALTLIENHNNKIDNFINNILPELLKMAGVHVTQKDNGEYVIPMNVWFKAQSFIKTMNFYKDAIELLNILRKNGFDVKIDMQSDKLVLY